MHHFYHFDLHVTGIVFLLVLALFVKAVKS